MKQEISNLAEQLTQKQITFHLPGEDNFEQLATNIYPSLFLQNSSKKPEIVILPKDENQISETIKLIKNLDTKIGIRSGGFSPGGQSIPPEGIIVSLKNFEEIKILREQQRIEIGGGANMQEVNEALEGSGFWVPIADGDAVGYSGFLLHGGISHQYGKFIGLACDFLVSATLVLSNGEIIEVNEDSHPELFKGLKGAGSVFGVVTKMTMQLINTQNLSHDYFHYSYSPQLLQKLVFFAKNINQKFDDVQVCVFFGNYDSENNFLEITVAYNNINDENVQNVRKEILQQIKNDFPEELKDQGLNLKPCDRLPQETKLLMPFFGILMSKIPGYRICWYNQGFQFEFLTQENIEKIVDTYQMAIPQNQNINFFHGGYYHALGGKVKESTSWTGFKNNDIFSVAFQVFSPEQIEQISEHYKKVKEFNRSTEGIQGDVYSNIDLFPNNCEEQKFSDFLGGEENLKLLKELKTKYDPENVFRGNCYDQVFCQGSEE